MPSKEENETNHDDDCVVHDHPLPPEEVGRYSFNRDPHSEADIARYVESQADDEKILHVELIKTEYIVGEEYEIWDVTTDKDRWWVLTNLTNLYSQNHFPSLDYTISFHVGLMMRLRSRPTKVDSSRPDPLDEVVRRQEQAKDKFDQAVEAEDYQSVGMLLRECLLSLASVLRRRIALPEGTEKPQESNFKAWCDLMADHLCPGDANKPLRHFLKVSAKETWQLVNWLTHDRNADEGAILIAIHSCDNVIGHFYGTMVRSRSEKIPICPICGSRKIRTHFDIQIGEDGDYFSSCGQCDWDSHPLRQP